LQHCAVGKDRTGVGCALTLFAVGCDSETVMEEYLLTHGMLTQVESGCWNARHGDLTAGAPEPGGYPDGERVYLAAALSAIHERYGSVDAWLAKGISSPPGSRRAAAPGCWKNNVFFSPRGR
jgi:protein tyrosine/serine phosphatase